jgi:SWI/SNF chromatin-remodeling complex subunit SWI1
LLDVIVDVLEDVTFGSEEEVEEEELFEEDPWLLERPQTWTRPALLRQLGESDNLIGNAVRASKIQKYGPKQDPATVVLTILNLLMNFLGHSTNQSTLANHARLLDTLARICDVIPSQSMPSTWRPLSDELELNELLRIQSETVSFLSMLDLTGIRLANQERRTPRRFYNLFISYIIDPAVSLAPRNILPSFIPSTSPAPNVHLHGQVDTALDAFVKLSARDANRIVLARPSVIPQSLLILHFQSLAQMLPVTEEDFLATTPNFGNAPSSAFPSGLETLVSFVERVVHSLHSIAFFAPPPLKKRLRAETPGLVQILTRMAQYYIGGVRRSDGYVFGELPGPGGKGLRNNPWIIVVRRIYETLSLLDLCEDAFDPLPDTPLAFAPPSARGGGGGSGGGDSKGLLASRLSELLVTGLLRETNDDVAFRELDSLLRLGPGGGITFKDTTGIVY